MTQRVTARRRGSYGVDAPYAPVFIAVLFIFELTLGIISGSVGGYLAAGFVLVNFTVDLLYAVLDPRIRHGRA